MPEALAEEIDRLGGKKGRSAFIAKAAERASRHWQRPEALDEFAGWLMDVDIPGWETSESAAAWVREQRRGWAGNEWANSERGE
jgi:hypothetical protein